VTGRERNQRRTGSVPEVRDRRPDGLPSGIDPGSDLLNSWLDLAVTRSPTLLRAVPWAQRSFTAEFGMGSGGASAL
jgi:hypothetical protein